MKKINLFVIIAVSLTAYLLIFENIKPILKDVVFMSTIEISPFERALTFARVKQEGKIQLLAVIAYEKKQLSAINITKLFDDHYTDPIILFNEFGYDAIKKKLSLELKNKAQQIKVGELILPLELTDSHIATGTNFSAHAEESDVEEGPFLFAKLVTPTPFQASVSASDGLLDFEVELSFVTLTETKLPEVPEFMGLILSNDFTDRAKLMRNLNPDDVTSGDGFTTGKSAPGYLPVGNLFVIPRDLKTFVDNIELKLSVGGKLRQRGSMKQLIWDIEEILKQTLAKQGIKWKYNDKQITLPIKQGILPARTLILSGTPEGTIFAGVSTGTKLSGLFRWLTGGWGQSVTDNVIEQYIKSSIKSGNYLQPGDKVVIQVEQLGTIETLIKE